MVSMQTAQTIRKFQRYLGYFLAGIMMLYASSGVLLIFRGTDTLKVETVSERQLEPGLSGSQLLQVLKVKGLSITSEEPSTITLSSGSYDRVSGLASVTTKDYLPGIKQVTQMHKATHNSPLYFLNIAFGSSLLFFSVSAFFLFPPKAPALKAGVKVAAGGFVFALLVVLLG